jgi:isopentenyl-diphosphate Delta-isomerase
MRKVSPIETRKDDHLRINLEESVGSGLTTGLEHYRFIHEAMPELDLGSVATDRVLFNKQLSAPILISSMTGGTEEAGEINLRLAEAAQECGVALGVGSQRIALEEPNRVTTYSITRRVAPGILLFANLGAIQLNYGFGLDECIRAVDIIQADGLILHLNSLQEALQNDGDTNFGGLAKKIESVCRKLELPVIVKEVGWGISERTAKILAECGVTAIDVAGAGGTSWSQVEMHRASDDFSRELAASFIGWGIPTSDSILNVKKAASDIMIFASGGLKNGMDIAKCLALGAVVGGLAGPVLRAVAISTKKAVEFIQLTRKQLQVSMFAAGIKDLDQINETFLERI